MAVLELEPQAEVTVTYIPLVDSFLEQPAIFWHTIGTQMHNDSQATHDGALRKHTGEIHSPTVPCPVDTTKTAGGGTNTFSVVLGGSSWDDTWVSPKTGKKGLIFQNSTDGQSFEVLQDGTIAMKDLFVRIHRGITDLNTSRFPSGVNTYLELNYGYTTGWRLAFEVGTPVKLQYRNTNVSSSWLDVHTSGHELDSSQWFYDFGGELTLKIHPDPYRGGIHVEFPRGMVLKHYQTRPGASGNDVASLPSAWKLRFSGKNGFAGLETGTYRHPSLTVKPAPKKMAVTVPNIGSAEVVPNVLGPQTTAEGAPTTVSASLAQAADGSLEASITGSRDDAGDGNGSLDPCRFSDILIYIPPVWNDYYGGSQIPINTINTVRVIEHSRWDDQARMAYTQGDIIFSNHDLRYSGAVGNYAINIVGGNGQRQVQRCRGIAGMGDPGIMFLRQDPVRIGSLPYADFMAKLASVDLAQELIFDGWSVHTAVRELCMQASIHPRFLTLIPDDGRPPYPDNDSFLPILGKGTGMNPKYRFLPNRSVLSCIQELVLDTGYPISRFGGRNLSIPYYFWFDNYANAHFQPYDAGLLLPKAFYNTQTNLTNVRPIKNSLRVYNSVNNMRTDVTVQGQDALDYSLINVHRPLSELNKWVVGYRRPLVERNERWSSQKYAEDVADTLAIQASLGTQIVEFDADFWPDVFVGDLIGVDDDALLAGGLYGSGLYVVMDMTNEYGYDPHGSGIAAVNSTIRARSAENSVAW